MKIVLNHLTKRFPNRNKKIKEDVVAVDDFNIEFPDGKLIGLLGPSGCGKSTMLNLISGLETPTEGRVFFGEDDVTDLPPENRGVGLVFQSYALYPHLTVEQNIQFPLDNIRGADKPTKEQKAEKVMEAARLVQIEDYMERKPSELSGGQQQRVAIARSLVKRPRVLLLDEPLSNLDARLRLQTREEIKRIQRETGITTVFVTHDQDEAMSISDLIVVMKAGALQQIGKPQEVYEHPANQFVAQFLGTPPINMFDGRVEDGKLYIGKDCVLNVSGCEDGEYNVGVRPEGFLVLDDGHLICRQHAVEEQGRDITVVSGHEAFNGAEIRSIVLAEYAPPKGNKEVRFDIKPSKIHLFDKENGSTVNCSFTAL